MCLARANFVSRIDASLQALSELPHPAASGGAGDRDVCCDRKHVRTTLQAVSFDTTSHNPSLAKIKHSSSPVLSNTVTSGSEITYGFK